MRRKPLPPGRLDWSAPPGRQAVYSLQSAAVWQAVREGGSYELPEDAGLVDGDFELAYRWLRDQMRLRLITPMARTWPIWGWTRTTRRDLAVGLRQEPGDVLLRLEVPVGLVLESDFDGWHAVLNSSPLWPYDLDPKGAEWDVWEQASDRLREAKDRCAIEATWAGIFERPRVRSARYRQATMPTIDLAWVASVYATR